MGFGDLKAPSGLKVLNDFLADRSYVEGHVPSQADVAVFEAIATPPPAELCHALRWFNHIKSYQSQKNSLPGVKKPLGQYGPAGVGDSTAAVAQKGAAAAAAAAADDDDDDEVDLFGSDDEEDAEAARLKEERVAAYAARKANKPAETVASHTPEYLESSHTHQSNKVVVGATMKATWVELEGFYDSATLHVSLSLLLCLCSQSFSETMNSSFSFRLVRRGGLVRLCSQVWF
ncbi:elongation factor 1-beta isoform X2 [Hippocampus zosterae]|uniref:elongation factor 1-beta isoform X2 n=1 Tax=Hippocampus zosterae TaxID=109293 RepID=UPI00223E5E77|nr:elongation factor 1-beta isoform X2 [Hippocampus zosterae]